LLTESDYITSEKLWREAKDRQTDSPLVFACAGCRENCDTRRKRLTRIYKTFGTNRPVSIEPSDTAARIRAWRFWKDKDARAAKMQRGYRFTPMFGWYHPDRSHADQVAIDTGG